MDHLNYYVTLTTRCNLNCAYCYGKSCEDFGSNFGKLKIDYSIPTSISYEFSDLITFLGQDPDPTVIFYGGEPLLELEKMTRIMEIVKARRFIIQTNGLLLDRLGAEHVKKLDTVLVSIDGDEAQTDFNRGRGVYRRVIENLRLLESRGFSGEVIARMTVTVGTEIDRQVSWLVSDCDHPFKSVHWQLDALFWQNDFDRSRFEAWSHVYDQGIKRLVEFWVERMRSSGEVLRLYPFIAVMQSLLLSKKSKLRCGAGWNTFNIQTDGTITPCPVMAGMKDFYLGNIRNSTPSDLKDAVLVKTPCTECQILTLCGGRCLYANVTRLWGEDGFDLVCDTVRNLVECIKDAEPGVRQLISDGRIGIGDFEYGRYNSCEIIP